MSLYKDLESSLVERSAEEQELFNKQLEEKYKNISAQDVDKILPTIGEHIAELKIAAELPSVLEIVSISYIAEKNFNKSRVWLSQKINRNIVNGKPSKFTASELEVLRSALEDIAYQIHNTSAKLKLSYYQQILLFCLFVDIICNTKKAQELPRAFCM
ncbi:MAG: DUF5053 domain-containing protein [Bacteroidales bacterium]